MKVKKLLLSLLLLISCAFAFSACTDDITCVIHPNKDAKFNFDENGTVILRYTCYDEEKNFNAELSAEQSHEFILSLNEISFSEINNIDLNMAPPYDDLIIKVNNESLHLHDVAYFLNNGGYFYFNNKLCKTKEKFGFLESYLVEYCPDIMPSSVSFGVRYVKQTVDAEENYQIIRSVSQLNSYIATETKNINLPDIKLFKDEVINKYTDEYFANSFIVIFMKAVGSGSFDFRVNDVSLNGSRLIINYKIALPADDEDLNATCDMAYWYTFVELSNEYSAIQNVDLNSLK